MLALLRDLKQPPSSRARHCALRDLKQPGLLAHLRIGMLKMSHQARCELDELRVAPGEACDGRRGGREGWRRALLRARHLLGIVRKDELRRHHGMAL